MSGVSVTVDDREVRAALDRLSRSVRDMTPAMRSIGQALVTATDLAFRSQSDPWGRPWDALSPVTLKRRRGTSAQILRDTGRLANSISYRADAQSVEVGTDVVYAATHQFGATKGAFGRTRRGAPIPWGNIPARPFLPIRDGSADLPRDTVDDILDIVSLYLEGRRG